MTPFDLPTNLAIFGLFLAVLMFGLVVAVAPLEWLARKSERFSEWLDGVVERVL